MLIGPAVKLGVIGPNLEFLGIVNADNSGIFLVFFLALLEVVFVEDIKTIIL